MQDFKITLNNGVKMPIIGYGVYQIDNLKKCQECVENAINIGYRLIDTAQSYGNEEAVGQGIINVLKSGIKREEIFITTKLWLSDANETKALKAFDYSLKKLKLDYVDLYLIHQPYSDIYGAYRAMSKLYKEGRIKAIGVSNFYPDRLIDFVFGNEIKPAINQVECNPFHAQFQAQKLMQDLNVQMQSWAPFGEGKNNIFNNETIANIGLKYQKTNAQVILRWLIQRNIIVIPKTTQKARMFENFNIFDFSLNEQDMLEISKLDNKESLFFNHQDPNIVKQMYQLKR